MAQQPIIQPVTSGAAARQGFLYGAILGILSLPVIALVTLSRLGGVGGGQTLLIGFAVIAIILTFMAGLVASRRTGRLSSGVGAGLLAGALAGFIAVCLGTVIIILLAPYIDLRAARIIRLTGRRGPGLIADILRLFYGGVILAVIGLIMGTLGGLIGRIRRGSGGNAGNMAAGYVSGGPVPTGYAAPNQSAPSNQGYQSYQPYHTPIPGRTPLPADSDLPGGSYSSTLGEYHGDDPTTLMPNPQYPTPIPDDLTSTPSAQQPTGL